MKRNVLMTAGTAVALASVMAGCTHNDKAVSVGNAAVTSAGASNTKVSSTARIKTSPARWHAPPLPARSTSPSGGPVRAVLPLASAPC